MPLINLEKLRFGPTDQSSARLIFTSLALNIAGALFAPVLHGLLYLDMLGTALTAIALGPWWGATIGLSTNLILWRIPGHEEYFKYAIVNVLGGIFWGFASYTRVGPFRKQTTPRQLLLRLILLGLLGGIVCSTAAMYIRFGFLLRVPPAILSRTPQLRAPDIVPWLAHFVFHPTYFFEYVPLDALSMIPEKIISIAFGAFVLYYFFRNLPAVQERIAVSASRFSAIIFVIIYAVPFGFVCFREFVNAGQVLMWFIPVALALVSIKKRRQSSTATPTESSCGVQPSLDVEGVYKDVIYFVLLWYTVLAGPQLFGAIHEIEALIKGGVGIFGGVAAFVYGPPLVKHYFAPSEGQ